jgi:serine/threonine-protein kinase
MSDPDVPTVPLARSRVRDLFERVADLDARERDTVLDGVGATDAERAALATLLAADTRADGPFARPAAQWADALDVPMPGPAGLVGASIGPYRLIELVGQGATSMVFRAERDIEGAVQTVALKLLRTGLYSDAAQRRFRRERAILMRLSHPHIARLVDGGVSAAGVPYLTMEFVAGRNLVAWADGQSLDQAARLRLLVDLCDAVDAAHHALIVHRDLKPGNVLVTGDGTVKVLDFGIARLLDDDEPETATLHIALTPGYAAPEQYRSGVITTAADVYALGVIAGELLLGTRLGVDAAPLPGLEPDEAAALRARLRVLDPELRDLLRNALAAEPGRRYASARHLADDIGRFLRHEPLTAHPPSRWYRLRKFVQRHRAGVATTLAVAVALVAALGVALHQRGVAERAAQRASAMRDFMVAAFARAEPGAPRTGPPSVVDVVEQAVAAARGDPRMNPGVRADLVSGLGEVLRAQGRLTQARDVLQWNYDRAVADLGAEAPLTLTAGRELASTLILAGDYPAARTLLDTLLARVGTQTTTTAMHLHLDAADLASKVHELARARSQAAAGLALARRLGDDEALREALDDTGNVQLSVHDAAASVATYQELLALRIRRFGPEHVDVADTHASLSRAYRHLGRLADAEREIRAALAIDQAVLPPNHWRHGNHLNALTMVLLAQRDYRGARDAARGALAIDRVAYGNDHPETATDLNNVGMLDLYLEDYPAAATALREALDLSIARFGAEHFETAVTRANYGLALGLGNQLAQGETELRHALATFAAQPDANPDDQAAALEKLARVELAHGDGTAALPLVDRIDALVARIAKPSPYWDGRATVLRARALRASGQPAAARTLLAAAAASLAASSHPDAVLAVEVPLLQAAVAARLGDAADAARYAATGRAALARLRSPPARLVALARTLPDATAPPPGP